MEKSRDAVKTVKNEYSGFQEKVKRCVLVDNLSPSVTLPILKKALEQFGRFVTAQILPNNFEDKSAPVSALVEMKTEKDAKNIVTELTVNAFMIAGAPRPVRATLATPEMFSDRPALPGRKIQCIWIKRGHANWEAASNLKTLARKQAAQASFLLKHLREGEESLAKQQETQLRGNYKKNEQIDNLASDGTLDGLARRKEECFCFSVIWILFGFRM